MLINKSIFWKDRCLKAKTDTNSQRYALVDIKFKGLCLCPHGSISTLYLICKYSTICENFNFSCKYNYSNFITHFMAQHTILYLPLISSRYGVVFPPLLKDPDKLETMLPLPVDVAPTSARQLYNHHKPYPIATLTYKPPELPHHWRLPWHWSSSHNTRDQV